MVAVLMPLSTYGTELAFTNLSMALPLPTASTIELIDVMRAVTATASSSHCGRPSRRRLRRCGTCGV